MPLLSSRRSTPGILMDDGRTARDKDDRRRTSTAAGDAHDAHDSHDSLPPPFRRPATAQPMSHRPVSFLCPDSPPIHDTTPATRKFGRLRWRHFSDTHLAATAKAQAAHEETPPVPPIPDMSTQPPATAPTAAPAIITTAPTVDPHSDPPATLAKSPFKRQMSRFSPSKHLHVNSVYEPPQTFQPPDHAENSKHLLPWRRSFEKKDRSKNQLQRVSTADLVRSPPAPPAYGDESNTSLALPVERLSDSSNGDRSSGEHVTYATTTTTHTISTTTTLFKLPRRNRKKSSLFPLPAKTETPPQPPQPPPVSPRASTSALSAHSVTEPLSTLGQTPIAHLHRRHTDASRPRPLASPSASSSYTFLTKSAAALAAHSADPLVRDDSTNSNHSAQSSPVVAPAKRFPFRDRSSTMGSLGRGSEDLTPPTPPIGSGRNSTSTSGRTSLGGFLSFNRFRLNSDAQGRNTSPASHSKSSSFAMPSKEALNIPEREEGDTPGKYLERLQATVSRSLIAGILSKSSDPFAQAVLRSYSRKFPFFGEPIDMSLRKFLLEAELPKETQQVDRVIQAFADRYHECNPGIFQSSDKTYIVAFSLMMLHTDAFNKNNKRKMQKHDYIKNTSGQNVADDILACFYDNICYTPFIHFDEEVDINGERLLTFKPNKKSKLRGTIPDPVRKNSGPIDPYALICDGKLDMLRPPLKEIVNTDDPYTYLGTAGTLDIHKLQKAFVNTAVLQIISARSRPAAFESQATRDNPNDTAAGVVDLKITKVGLIWRKSAKRKKTRSPWQEWGALMTGSQLYLFKNIAWVKTLMAQQQAHDKQNTGSPVVFQPPIQNFKPDELIKTDDAVALLDAGYTRHKDAFTLVRHGGQEEVLIAENESEMNQWIALINYAAAFRSAGVRIRGFIGATETDPVTRAKSRLNSTVSASEPVPGTELSPQRLSMAPELVQQVLVFRGKIMRQTIFESEREIEQMTISLESMLRNTRHLLLLAPIQDKTREEVINAAARMNANLRWMRRDIWRIKCHRDILARDLDLDGDLFNEKPTSPPAVAVHQPSGAPMLIPPPASVTASPLTPRPGAPPADAQSADDFFGDDVFRTPPEHAPKDEPMDAWKLPALDLDADRQQDRLSVKSASQSLLHKRSAAAMSVSSSAYDRQHSFAGSESGSRPRLDNHAPSFDDREREVLMLARDDLAPTVTATSASSAGPSQVVDLTSASASPESTTKSKTRRSIHRALREARHEHPSIHRHRKGKDSASTVKSDSSHVGDLGSDSAPVLERSTGKFMVHGKKASVVTFGGDWSEETLRLRREMEIRNQLGDFSIDTDGSSPEDNLRRHIARELAAFEATRGGSNGNAAPAIHRTFSDTDATLLADMFNFSHGPRTSWTQKESASSYFDMSKGEEERPIFTQPVFPPPTQEIIQDPHKEVPPEQLPLPSSPPAVFYDEHEEQSSPTHITDETLRQLSYAGVEQEAHNDQVSQATPAVGA